MHDQQARTMKSNADASSLHVFGIRHHGPGSARSVRRALEELKPDCVLVEGPPDGEAVLPLLAHKDMKPPVAMLIYVPDDPRRAVYYPFAIFSPEWQAIEYALKRRIPVRFMDLPHWHQLAGLPELAVAQANSINPDQAPSAEGQPAESEVSED